MDAYDGYVAYRMLDEEALAPEIAQMRDLMERDWRTLDIDQDLGLGMMLWLAHFFPDEPWATGADKAGVGNAGHDVDRSTGLFLPCARAI